MDTPRPIATRNQAPRSGPKPRSLDSLSLIVAITHRVIVDAGVAAAFDAFTARLGE